ncbi:hypothetical protein SAMN02800692_1936 [Luteibacter sp. UNC138MFCol5.1]|uniref:hypothetical protein n=1 Tax=Luteibacter sp. UNC138MFCol5.1 TaxID=1502774 RepID=UPI0008AF5B72|nr:hypothetical protein [Luteibacter sp. UNC138MFCol5.1]SEO75492.1 hypothetical protein SAMN02800692_1936 [Luteibacter sp. UNC138MFCol5.1]
MRGTTPILVLLAGCLLASSVFAQEAPSAPAKAAANQQAANDAMRFTGTRSIKMTGADGMSQDHATASDMSDDTADVGTVKQSLRKATPELPPDNATPGR